VSWKPIVTAAAGAIGRPVEGTALVDALDRAASGQPFSLERIDGAAFLGDLDRAMRRDHAQWSPLLLAQTGAALQILPALFARLRRASTEQPVDPARLRADLDQLVAHAAVQDEPPGTKPRCPRCGSANLKTQKTTATGRQLYEHSCKRCGHFFDEDLGPAPQYGSKS
jgi:hypothetical protein